MQWAGERATQAQLLEAGVVGITPVRPLGRVGTEIHTRPATRVLAVTMAAITPVRAVGRVLTRPARITMAGPATQVVMAEDFTRDMFPRPMATRIMPDTIGDGKGRRANGRFMVNMRQD